MQIPMNAINFVLFVMGFVSLLVMLIAMFAVPQHQKPDSQVRLFNSFNIIAYPSELTETGLAARRWVFRGFFSFFGYIILLIIINGNWSSLRGGSNASRTSPESTQRRR